jgi:hypothetical protein
VNCGSTNRDVALRVNEQAGLLPARGEFAMARDCLRYYATATVMAAVTVTAWPVLATEDGNSHADLGYIDTLAGLPLAPGLYLRDDVNIISSGRFNDQNGKQVNLNLGALGKYDAKFRSYAEADIVSGAYVPDYKIPYLNATIGVAFYEFIASSRAELATKLGVPDAGASTKGGFGDITIVPLFLSFDVPDSDFHFTFSPFEFTAPVGRYDKNDPIGNNTGLNYWSYRPALEMTYLNRTGQEFSINMGASINTQNQATHYKSGDEFYFTYAMQQYTSPQFAFGIGGYYYKQVTDDTLNGVVVNTNTSVFPFDPLNGGPGNKGETFAIGPIVSYNFSQDLVFQAHWDHEIFAYNRSLKDQFFVRASFRF